MPTTGLRRRRRSTRRGHGALAMVSLLAVACDDGTKAEPPASSVAPLPDAEAYGTVLATILDDTAVPEGQDRTVVYLVPLDEGAGIETQAAVIDRFAAAYDVRFVDELGAAIDDGDPRQPPRDDAVVIGFGTITSEAPHLVRLERYRAADDVDANLLTIEARGEGWVVIDSEPVTPEVLIDVP